MNVSMRVEACLISEICHNIIALIMDAGMVPIVRHTMSIFDCKFILVDGGTLVSASGGKIFIATCLVYHSTTKYIHIHVIGPPTNHVPKRDRIILVTVLFGSGISPKA